MFTRIVELFLEKSWKTAPESLNLHSAISGDVHSLFWVRYMLRWHGIWHLSRCTLMRMYASALTLGGTNEC